MRAIYISRKNSRLLLFFAAALALISLSLHWYMPPGLPVEASPYRQGLGGMKQVSLAVNVDWGEEFIPDMLSVLAQYQVKATFFLTGRWADKNGDLADEIARAGHEIGNHAYSHISPNNSSYDTNVAEILRTEQAIEKVTGIKTSLYAPPSGECEEHVLRAAADCGYTTILWSVDTIDWQRPPAATIVQRVESKVHDGAIILAHPTAPTLEALPTLLVELQQEGYRFVTVSENIGL